MKYITENKHLQSTIIEWMLIKGPQLFVTIYGK